jgi:hypothetical protein
MQREQRQHTSANRIWDSHSSGNTDYEAAYHRPPNVDQSFGGTCHLHLLGRRISQARDHHKSRLQALHCLPPDFILISCFEYSSIMKSEATCSSETSVVIRRITWRYVPRDKTLHASVSTSRNTCAMFSYLWLLAFIHCRFWCSTLRKTSSAHYFRSALLRYAPFRSSQTSWQSAIEFSGRLVWGREI